MTPEDDRSDVIPLIKETVRVLKADVVTGHVRVRTVTEATDHVVAQELETENVEITRVSVEREVAEAPAVRQEGDVTIVSIVEEMIVVTKRLIVTEEIHIRRIKSTEHFETSINLRKQHAVVERTEATDDSITTKPLGEKE
jgi:stress response protein YsnF